MAQMDALALEAAEEFSATALSGSPLQDMLCRSRDWQIDGQYWTPRSGWKMTRLAAPECKGRRGRFVSMRSERRISLCAKVFATARASQPSPVGTAGQYRRPMRCLACQRRSGAQGSWARWCACVLSWSWLVGTPACGEMFISFIRRWMRLREQKAAGGSR